MGRPAARRPAAGRGRSQRSGGLSRRPRRQGPNAKATSGGAPVLMAPGAEPGPRARAGAVLWAELCPCKIHMAGPNLQVQRNVALEVGSTHRGLSYREATRVALFWSLVTL